MLNKFIIILFFPVSIFAQTTSTVNSASEKIIDKDCDKKFTKTEVLPSFKISREAFEDSLMLYLRSRDAVIKDSSIPFRFFLTSRSQILDLDVRMGYPSRDQPILRDAIMHFSDLWKPAEQNFHIVCSYVNLLVQFKNDKVNVIISQ